MKHSVGIRRLHELVGGAFPTRASTLVHGSPFLGKEALAAQFLLDGLDNNVPGILVTTRETAEEAHGRLARMQPAAAEHVAAGRLRVVDAYTRAIGGEEARNPGVAYVDGPSNLNGILAALSEAQHELALHHDAHRVALDSASTISAVAGSQATFRFTQILVGSTRRAGGSLFLLVDDGMHSPGDLQALRHLCDAEIAVRQENDRNLIHVEGMPASPARGWVEYRHSSAGMEITGSLAGGRIR